MFGAMIEQYCSDEYTCTFGDLLMSRRCSLEASTMYPTVHVETSCGYVICGYVICGYVICGYVICGYVICCVGRMIKFNGLYITAHYKFAFLK